MSKYEQLIAKVQKAQEFEITAKLTLPTFSKEEWELLEEALITLQFLETIFAVRARNLKDYE